MVSVGHHLAPPNLPPGEVMSAAALKQVLGGSRYIYLLPSRVLAPVEMPSNYYVSYSGLAVYTRYFVMENHNAYAMHNTMSNAYYKISMTIKVTLAAS